MSRTVASISFFAMAATGVLAAACGSSDTIGVTGVALKQATSIAEGATEQLGAVVSPANATDQRVTWASDNPAVAAVSATGLVTAVALGTARVSVTTADGHKTATCVVTVARRAVAATGIALDASRLRLVHGEPGASGALTATVSPADATDQNVSWTTSDAAVATLSTTAGSAVIVTAHAAGAATIRATTRDGGHVAECPVNVALLDQPIAANTASASFFMGSPGSGTTPPKYHTRAAAEYGEIRVGDLLFFSDWDGFMDGGAEGGLELSQYASLQADPVVLGSTQRIKSYVAIPPLSAPSRSLKVIVTAKAAQGSLPRVALGRHVSLAGGVAMVVPFALGSLLSETAAEYEFDGVPKESQIDVFDGARDGNDLFVLGIRVEPSAAPPLDAVAPAPVSSLVATPDLVASTQVALSWTNPADADLDHVEITSPGLAAPISVAAPASTCTVPGLTPEATYAFTLQAVDRSGNRSAAVRVTAQPGVVPTLLRVTIPVDVVASLRDAGSGRYDTSNGTESVQQEVGGLLYFAQSGAFQAGDADGGIMFSRDAAGASAATVDPSQQRELRSYIGIPPVSTTRSTVRVTVTAKPYPGPSSISSGRIALARHVSASGGVGLGIVIAVSDVLGEKRSLVFDGVPANTQIDVFSGGPDGTYMYVEQIVVQ